VIQQKVLERVFNSTVRARDSLLSEQSLQFSMKLQDPQKTISNASTVQSTSIECLYFFELVAIVSGKPIPRLNAYLPIAQQVRDPKPLPVEPAVWNPTEMAPVVFEG
jgi:hypothetical protein